MDGPNAENDVERRRSGRVEYTNPHLIRLLRGLPASDDELLGQRFSLARRMVTLAHSADLATAEGQREHEHARVDLDACEAECRRRGLIR